MDATPNKKKMDGVRDTRKNPNQDFVENPPTVKRSLEVSEDKKIVKRKIVSTGQFDEKALQEVKNSCVKISSLTTTRLCPRIEGTLTYVSIWRSMFGQSRYTNFVLEDASGQIKGIIYRRKDLNFEKKFVVGATLSVKNAKVQHVKENFQDRLSGPYELIIHDSVKTVTIENVLPAKNTSDDEQSAKSKINTRILISDIVEKSQNKELVDVICILDKVEEPIIKNYDKEPLIKRNLQIIDESSMSMTVTIWHDLAKNFNAPIGSVLAISQAAVRIYGNLKSLTFSQKSLLEVDPLIDAAERLKNWYRQYNSNDVSLAQKFRRKVVAHGKKMCDEANGDEEKTSTTKYLQNRLISINEIHEMISVGEKIDTIGLVLDVLETEQVMTEQGNLITITTIFIADENRTSIKVTIRSDESDKLNIPVNSIVVARKAKVCEFNNVKKLDCLMDKIEINPDIPDVKRFKKNLPENNFPTVEEVEERRIQEYSENILDSDIDDKFLDVNMIKVKPATKIDISLVAFSKEEMLLTSEHEHSESTRKIEMTNDGRDRHNDGVPPSSIAVAENAAVCEQEIITNIPETDELEDFRANWMSKINEIDNLMETHKLDFTKIDVINKRTRAGQFINVLGVIRNIITIEYSSDGEIEKIMLKLMDESEDSIWMTICGDNAKKFNGREHLIVAVKNVELRSWNKRKDLNCMNNISSIIIEPYLYDAMKLRQWYGHLFEAQEWLSDNSHNGWLNNSEVFRKWWHEGSNKYEKWFDYAVCECQRRLNGEINEYQEWHSEESCESQESLDDESHDSEVLLKEMIPICPLTPIDQLVDGQTTNVLGIITKIHEPRFVRPDFPIDIARVLEIVDQSEKNIGLILWSERARDFDIPEETAIVATNVNVFVKGDKKVCKLTFSSDLKIEFPEVQDDIERLKSWYAAYKRSKNPENLNENFSIHDPTSIHRDEIQQEASHSAGASNTSQNNAKELLNEENCSQSEIGSRSQNIGCSNIRDNVSQI